MEFLELTFCGNCGKLTQVATPRSGRNVLDLMVDVVRYDKLSLDFRVERCVVSLFVK